jgi:phosphotransferase system HPr-like phosphotransfer protein
MKTINIRLSTIADVRDFVNIVSKSDIDIDLASGRYLVDAKSIMGIFSLDLLHPIEMTIHGEAGVDTLMARIERFIVE